MKKRAQRPDAHTFTTLFRGYASNIKAQFAHDRAVAIYHSMFADNSPVKPSVIHTNAVLKVCALAGDIDGLFGVAAKLPSRGDGSPNNLTYTTILNAIRSETWHATQRQPMSHAVQEKRLQAIKPGKRLWAEIKQRWAKGDLYIDEELVCAMGRLLLITIDEKDCDDVLSLVEQTMNVPRQVPRIGEPDSIVNSRHAEKIIVKDEDNIFPHDKLASGGTHNSATGANDDNTSNLDIFAPKHIILANPQFAVKPGRNTLSMLLDACVRGKRARAAQNYWGLLTDPAGPYNIVPDNENYHMYLRLLRLQRASKLAAEMLDNMHKGTLGSGGALQAKTFRIALSACVRDKNNNNSLVHAKKIVHLMYESLPHPDARTLNMYLELTSLKARTDWRALLAVVHDIDIGIKNIRSLLAYDPIEGKKQEDDLRRLIRATISALDKVLDHGNEEISDTDREWCKHLMHKLMAWLTRKVNRVRRLSEKKLDKKKPVLEVI